MLPIIDTAALIYMIATWLGYSRYAKYRAQKSTAPSLSRTLRAHREAWIKRMLTRDLRVGDASLLANQERVVAFFASTTVLMLAAVLTGMSNSDLIANVTTHSPLSFGYTPAQIEIKFFILALILIYAFFTVTWSLRQYGFVSVLIGSAPLYDEDLPKAKREAVILNIAKLMDCAGHDHNSGLRAYYFCLAIIFWLFNVWLFIAVTTLVIVVLYQREFKSKAITSMADAYHAFDEDSYTPTED